MVRQFDPRLKVGQGPTKQHFRPDSGQQRVCILEQDRAGFQRQGLTVGNVPVNDVVQLFGAVITSDAVFLIRATVFRHVWAAELLRQNIRHIGFASAFGPHQGQALLEIWPHIIGNRLPVVERVFTYVNRICRKRHPHWVENEMLCVQRTGKINDIPFRPNYAVDSLGVKTTNNWPPVRAVRRKRLRTVIGHNHHRFGKQAFHPAFAHRRADRVLVRRRQNDRQPVHQIRGRTHQRHVPFVRGHEFTKDNAGGCHVSPRLFEPLCSVLLRGMADENEG